VRDRARTDSLARSEIGAPNVSAAPSVPDQIMYDESCVFCRIVGGGASAAIVHRDEWVVAFRDIRPVAPTHILIVPASHIASLSELKAEDEALWGRLFSVAHDLAVQEKVDSAGYRVVVNTGSDAGQTVFHLHLHLIGGRRMHWPPG
jgi:histidine triad (HIT) family protein